MLADQSSLVGSHLLSLCLIYSKTNIVFIHISSLYSITYQSLTSNSIYISLRIKLNKAPSRVFTRVDSNTATVVLQKVFILKTHQLLLGFTMLLTV